MTESASNLQTLLDKFYLYCDTWKMKVNVDKTKIVSHSRTIIWILPIYQKDQVDS
jgi:hypothetical protein